ncbi:jg14385 [Pararge aegeria aegeria]|uniref:Jg14385 protein n=1 Tax=Pararge aegeria aegeria TaxID=348720 RepID=A0A8S4QJZ2_9NEOP|nr:jg14385 [Pararge aegeria aegeria]
MERKVKLPPNFDRANNISDKVRLAILKNMLELESARVLVTLPIADEQVTNYEYTMDAINKYVSPRINEVFKRYKFNERKQKEGVSFERFFTAAKQRLVNCN